MFQSMTGHGTASVGKGSNRINAEIKALNGKFLEIKIKGIDIDLDTAKAIKNILAKKLIRGNIFINFENTIFNSNNSVVFNSKRFQQIEKIINNIKKDYNISIDLEKLININDIISHLPNEKINSKSLINAAKKSCDELILMRKNEGQVLHKDISYRIDLIESTLTTIQKNIPKENIARFNNYKKRINKLINDKSLDENRIIQEIAILSDKADITEEIIRIKSHLKHFKGFYNKKKSVGRKLNFIIQELSREINTLGAKSTNNKTVKYVIGIKDELEKIREQVQNIL